MGGVNQANVQFEDSHKVLKESLEKMHDYHSGIKFLPSTFDGYQILKDYNMAVDIYAYSLKKLAEQLVKENQEIPGNIKSTLTSYYSEVYDGIESHGKAYKGIYKYIEPSLNHYVGLNAQEKTAIDYQKEKIELEPLEVEMTTTYLNKIENATFTDEILSIVAKEKKWLNECFVRKHQNCRKIKTKLENLKNKLLEYSNQNMDSFSIYEKQKCVKYVIDYNFLVRDYNRNLLELARLEEKIIIVREKRFDPKGKEENLEKQLNKQLNKHPGLECKEAKFIRRKLAQFKSRKEAYKTNSRTFAKLGYKTGVAQERVKQIADNYYPADLKMIFDKAALWLPETLPDMESRKTELEEKAAEILKVKKEPVIADQSMISSTSKQPLQTLIGSAVTQSSNGLSPESQPDVSRSSAEFDKTSRARKLFSQAKRALGVKRKTYKVPESHKQKEDVLSH